MDKLFSLLRDFWVNILASIFSYILLSILKLSIGKIVLWILIINIIVMIIIHNFPRDVSPEVKRQRKIISGILVAFFVLLFCVLVLVPKTNDWLLGRNGQLVISYPTGTVFATETSMSMDVAETQSIPTQVEIIEEFRNKEMSNSWILVPSVLNPTGSTPPTTSPNYVEQGFIPLDKGLEILFRTDQYGSKIVGINKILPNVDVSIEMTLKHYLYKSASQKAGHIYLSYCDSLDTTGYPKCVRDFLNITFSPNNKYPIYYFGGEEFQNVQNIKDELEIICDKTSGKVDCRFPSLIASGTTDINQPKSVPILNNINSIFISYDLPEETMLKVEITHFTIVQK